MSLALCLLLNIAFAKKVKIYQVITSHPHDIEKIEPYIKTFKRDGRLWLVTVDELKIKPNLKKFLRETNVDLVKSYYVKLNKKSVVANPIVQEFLDKVSKEYLKSQVEKLASYPTRYAGTSENQKVLEYLTEILKSLGLEIKIQCYKANACSVIGRKNSKKQTNDVILVMGHFDSVGKSFAGADDNATGSSSVLEMARVLANYDSNKNIEFFLTNGEELGLYGAERYASYLAQNGEINNYKLAINMDMIGYNSNGVVELETDRQYEGLAKKFAELAQTYTTLTSKITIGAWGSDHVPFIQKGVPTLLTIEDWNTKTPCYHKACDKPDTVNYDYMTEITKLNLAAILHADIE